MSGHNVNIYFQEKTYSKIKPLIKQRKVSEFVNRLVERELEKEQNQAKEKLKKKLIAAYKREAKSKEMQEEMKIWEGVASDGLEDE